MKATLHLTVTISGNAPFPGDGKIEGKIYLTAGISLPAMPSKGDVIRFTSSFKHPGLMLESKVSEIRWQPKRNQQNVLEPVIDLEPLDLREDCSGRGTLEQERQQIISRVTPPLSEFDKKYGRVSFTDIKE
jgi:hypothetical protein